MEYDFVYVFIQYIYVYPGCQPLSKQWWFVSDDDKPSLERWWFIQQHLKRGGWTSRVYIFLHIYHLEPK